MVVSEKERKVKLDQEIELLTRLILEIVNHFLVSIVLYGSYGRDEGAFYRKNDEISLYNDFDLLLIVKKRVPDAEMFRLKQTLLDNSEVRWIDISQKTVSNLKKLMPSILNYDLKFGSRVIWGDTDILEFIPIFSPSQITLKDAELLYFTRLYTFLGSLDANAFFVGVRGEKSRFFRNQMAKAILAIVDILLLQKNKYHPSYHQRVDRLKTLYPAKREIITLSDWALGEKIAPNDTTMNPQETEDFFGRILKVYFEEMHIAFSKLYRKKIRTTDDLRKARHYSLQESVIRIKQFLVTGSLRSYNRKNYIRLIQSYAVESLTKEGTDDKDIFEKCKALVGKIDPNQVRNCIDWNSLRQIIVKLSR